MSSTYRHFESRPNHKEFCKYSGHLYYYNVNAFNRPTYFKDELLFLSNPDFYSQLLKKYYVDKEKYTYNRWGFQTDTLKSRFKSFNYDKESLESSYKNNYPEVKKEYLAETSDWLHKVLEICARRNIEVIITLTPVYSDYYANQIKKGVITRRDSILRRVLIKYPSTRIFDEERNTDFTVYDFLNENHLNPRGAEKFTKKLNFFINDSLEVKK